MFRLLLPLPLFLPAHIDARHAFSRDYDSRNIDTLEGEVVEVFYKNPHAHYYVEVTGEDGANAMR